MKIRIVSFAEAGAAFSLVPSDFIEEPCGDCSHGAGQHFSKTYRGGVTQADRRQGKCSSPGCNCAEYRKPSELNYYGA